MSRYIDFISRGSPHTKFSLGNPVHNEKLPTRLLSVKGIRVDGEVMHFRDESLPDRLHQSLVTTERLAAKGAVIDCLAFVALMQQIALPSPDATGHFRFHTITSPTEISDQDISNMLPLNLGDPHSYWHSVVPAHQEQTARYVQKLGDTGPLCLSGLQAARRIYKAKVARPMTDLRLR